MQIPMISEPIKTPSRKLSPKKRDPSPFIQSYQNDEEVKSAEFVDLQVEKELPPEDTGKSPHIEKE